MDYLSGPKVIILELESKEAVIKEGAMTVEERSERCDVAGFADGRGLQAKKCGQPLRARKEKRFSPGASERNTVQRMPEL